MILFADFRTDESRMAVVDTTLADRPFREAAPTLASRKGRSARSSVISAIWVRGKGRDVSIGLLAKLEKKVPELRKKIKLVVVAEGLTNRAVTWSGVRAAVSFGNTLAFALGVPVVGIEVDGMASAKEVEEQIRALPKINAKAKPQWLRAAYVGEPNITLPKSQPSL